MKSELTREMFTDLYAKGKTVTEIIGALSISRRTANYWRAGLGLPQRRRTLAYQRKSLEKKLAVANAKLDKAMGKLATAQSEVDALMSEIKELQGS